jgi:cysteine desulfurase/selenocysteine lyase
MDGGPAVSDNVVNLADQRRNIYDVDALRAEFPILSREIYGKPLVYLDNGASAQKPRAVIDAVRHAYEHEYANVHRGAHFLSGAVTEAYEGVRDKIAAFVNASAREEIVFAKNATEAINLVAYSWGAANLGEGDEVLITEMEHHANIVPWQLLEAQKGIKLRVIPVADDGGFQMDAFRDLMSDRTKLVSVTHVSNVLGTVVPVKQVVEAAHARGTKVLIDGAQGIVHEPVDVQEIGCDFYAFTGHKLYGPSGIGVLWARGEVLEAMPPWIGGGDMIDKVSFGGTTFADPPHRFEAGTPPIVQAIGLGAAVDFVSAIGVEEIAAHEHDLLTYATDQMVEIEKLRFIGTAAGKAAIVSFVMDDIHAYDVAAILDREGVAVRVGHHCAEPLMDRMGVEGTVRASFGLYNNHADVDALIKALHRVREKLG